MVVYLQLANDLIYHFESFEITHIPRVDNSEADKLARIGLGIDYDQECLVETLLSSSVSEYSINNVDEEETWMTLIIRYLGNRELPPNKFEAWALRKKTTYYVYKFGQLYTQGDSNPLLKCITPERRLYVMQEIHEGVCGNHTRHRSLLHKVIWQG